MSFVIPSLRRSVLVLALLAAGAVQAQSNGGFETPNLPFGSFSNAPSGASWIFTSTATGTAGISDQSSSITTGAPEVPGAQQVGFIKNDGAIEQTVFLAPGSVLSFLATQRPGQTGLQNLSIRINGVLQNFIQGDPAGAVTTTTITPPRDYYETYAVRLASVTSSGNYTVRIEGLGLSKFDVFALLDSVAVSTPTSKAYGFWDNGFTTETWRSDLPTNTSTFAVGNCPYTLSNYSIVAGGGTPYGNGAAAPWGTPLAATCFNAASGPNAFPAYPASNWYSNAYVAGSPHWIVALNNESVVSASCASGPPNQSLPNVPAGSPGSTMLVTTVTAAADPAIGNKKVANIIYNSDTSRQSCIPYLAFGASSAHGNVQPIAIMDNAGSHRPRLKFKGMVTGTDGSSFGVVWLSIWTSGWKDGIRRLMQVDIGSQGLPSGPGTRMPFGSAYWNWNIKDSYYYPGAPVSQDNTQAMNSRCFMSTPSVSFTNTYIGSGHSPSSISNFDIDLYTLVRCMAANNGWFGTGMTQLPDPIVISGMEWSLETVQSVPAFPAPSTAIGIWDMRID